MGRSSAPPASSRLAPASQLLSLGCRLAGWAAPPREFATIASIYGISGPLSTGTRGQCGPNGIGPYGAGSSCTLPCAAAITPSATPSQDHRRRTVATIAALASARVCEGAVSQPISRSAIAHIAWSSTGKDNHDAAGSPTAAASLSLTSASPEWAALIGSAPQAAASTGTIP